MRCMAETYEQFEMRMSRHAMGSYGEPVRGIRDGEPDATYDALGDVSEEDCRGSG